HYTTLFRSPKNRYNISWIIHFGELAQLGERLRGTQEVVGSSTIFSITEERLHTMMCGRFLFSSNLIKNEKTQKTRYIDRTGMDLYGFDLHLFASLERTIS